MKYLCLVLFSISALSYSGYRELILSEEPHPMIEEYFGKRCHEGLKSFFRSGRQFELPSLKKRIKKLKRIRQNNPTDPLLLYHFTSEVQSSESVERPAAEYAGMIDLFKTYSASGDKLQREGSTKLFHSVLKGLRTEKDNFSDQLGYLPNFINQLGGVLYLTVNPFNATRFGNTLITIKMDSETLVFKARPRAEYPSNSLDYGLLERVERELLATEPDLSESCGATTGFFGIANLLPLILQDLGVDLILYNRQRRWFQLLNPEKINSTWMLPLSGFSLDRDQLTEALKKAGRHRETNVPGYWL